MPKPAFDLEPDDVRIEQRARVSMRDLTSSEDCWNEHAARVRERHEAHIVVVERVRGDAVGERRKRGARRDRRAHDVALTDAVLSRHPLRDARGRLACTREHHATRVHKGHRRPLSSSL
jgi:hypothetical protein